MLKSFFCLTLWALLGLAVFLAVAITWIAEGVGGHLEARGTPFTISRPTSNILKPKLGEDPTNAGAAEVQSQILFGDLHVHTTFSGDAFIFSLPLFQGEGSHPPADACDFARYCSGLDFWSINDHAEQLTPRQWSETKQAIRECNAASDSTDPDLVAFLGWEWTQSAPAVGSEDAIHYGHKNVVLLGTDEDEVPARPIGAGSGGLFESPVPAALWALVRFGMTLRDLDQLGPYLDFNRYAREVRDTPICPPGVPVRELPENCIEGAAMPSELFDKLEDWGFPSLVIPHGTAWGIHAPPRAKLLDQLSKDNHRSDRQRLFEIYSGHGNSESYQERTDFTTDSEGYKTCAEPSEEYLPCCWQAGELIRARCDESTSEIECNARVARARELALEASPPYSVVEGTVPDDWLDCGQLSGSFLPAFEFRPNMSAQYGLAATAEDGSTYRYGLIGSSDNHSARPGTGFKEVARTAFTDTYGLDDDWLPDPPSPLPQSVEPIENAGGLSSLLLHFERGASFYYTGGLVAVHAGARDRESIWKSLNQRHVYGTSGDRILLWFDFIDEAGERSTMGSEIETSGRRQFEVRAVGAFEQLPGCPGSIHETLGAVRTESLCLDQCYNPGERRHPIESIEVVRIRKQRNPDEPVAPLIEDPWLRFSCSPSREGCQIRFEDEEIDPERETVYYVRALQSPTPTINGDPLRCERDEMGRCMQTQICAATGRRADPTDDCLTPIGERAWSSPIFIRTQQKSG